MAIRVIALMQECRRDPFRGTGKPEPLRGELRGLWSRRLTERDRVVYAVSARDVEFHQARFHYDEA